MGHDKILVVGATGYIGKYIAKASAQLGHPTFALVRPSTLSDPAKVESLASLKEAGVQFLPGSLDDQQSLVEALKHVDLVISTVGGAQVHDQLNLVKAIKEVGHIKLDAGAAVAFYCKESGIPYTFVASHCFAGYFVATLSQADVYSPPRDEALVYGQEKGYFVEENDIAVYTVKAAFDPRAENKYLYISPAQNLMWHPELVELWEKKSGCQLQKTPVGEEDLLKKIDEIPFPNNIILANLYSLYIKGDQSGFEVPHYVVEATELYPDVEYTTVDMYLDRFL